MPTAYTLHVNGRSEAVTTDGEARCSTYCARSSP